jgi:Zn-dependent protease
MKLFGKIPLTLSSSFWVVAALIGYMNTESLIGTFLWISVIFVSVLVHELGHALVAYKLKLNPRIELIAFGGLTRYSNEKISLAKQFLITITGPLFGFVLFVISFVLFHNLAIHNVLLIQFLGLLQMVNLFWTCANFIPVLPLDGGHILRIGMEACFKTKGRYYAVLVSALFALVASVVFFALKVFLLGSFLFLFAYQNYMDLKKEKAALPEDINSKMVKAQEALNLGKKEEAFDLLFSIHKKLSGQSLYLLYKLAFDLGHYKLVTELSGSCFQEFPIPDVSLAAAKSHARESNVEAALGWLETTLKFGPYQALDLIADTHFDAIREIPTFSQWVKSRQT